MRYKALDIVRPIEELVPIYTKESWDNCGFLIGDKDKYVSSALLALDCSEDVVDEAIKNGNDIIITHHPLIFSPLKSITPYTLAGRTIEKAIKNNIIIYAAHTNLDKAEQGLSKLMADSLSLINCSVLSKDGFGLVGEVKPENKLYFHQLIELLKKQFKVDIIRCSKPINSLITTIAVCSGSGQQFIGDAIEKKAQVYISGDISYHNFYVPNNMIVIDIGHYGSEFGVTKFLYNLVSKNFANFAVSITEQNNNPIYYY